MNRFLTSAIVSAAAALILAGPSQAVEWKLAHWLPPTHAFPKTLVEEWAPSIEKESQGEIKFKVFPSSQLGKAPDHYDLARDGIADVTFINPGFNVGRWPVAAAGELFMLFQDPSGGATALTNWYRKHAAAKEMPDVKYCFTNTLVPNSFFSVKKAIRVPSDLKGMRVRPSNSTQARFIESQGGTNVFFPLPQVRDPIERGVIDTVNAVPFSLKLFGGHKAVKYVMKVPLTPLSWMVVINKDSYKSLSSKNRAIIDSHCTARWGAKMSANGSKSEHTGWKWYQDNGKEVFTLTSAEIEKWRTAAEPLVTAWKKDVRKRGYDADALLSDLKQEIKKLGASFASGNSK